MWLRIEDLESEMSIELDYNGECNVDFGSQLSLVLEFNGYWEFECFVIVNWNGMCIN